MEKLKDYLVNIAELIESRVLTEDEAVKAFQSGMQEFFDKRTYQDTTVDMALSIDSWIQKNFFRRTYSRHYSFKQDGTGCYSYDELVAKYEKGKEFPSTEKLSFFDWRERNYNRGRYGTTYTSKEADGITYSYDQLVEIYSKLK